MNEGKLGAGEQASVSDVVGERLKVVRTKAGLSQRELARRAGMTNGALSNIEQGKVSPSVSSLEKILGAIPVSLQEFFSAEASLPTSIFRRDSFARVNQNDTEYLMMSVGEIDHAAVYLSHQSFMPGALVNSEWMIHRGQIAGIVVSGRLGLQLDGIDYLLESREGFHFSIQRPHIFHNPGPDTCEIVSVSFAR
jgi:transcriptional regulator with XRE-family HTH domain